MELPEGAMECATGVIVAALLDDKGTELAEL